MCWKNAGSSFPSKPIDDMCRTTRKKRMVVVVVVVVVVAAAVAAIAAATAATEARAAAAAAVAAAAAAATSAVNTDASACYHLCTRGQCVATNIFVSFAIFQIGHACLHA